MLGRVQQTETASSVVSPPFASSLCAHNRREVPCSTQVCSSIDKGGDGLASLRRRGGGGGGDGATGAAASWLTLIRDPMTWLARAAAVDELPAIHILLSA